MQKQDLEIEDLKLDLANFRTVPQENEVKSLEAIVAINADWFWALLDSLLDSGYLPIENIVVLDTKKTGLIVKEGNRRVAALKIAHGLIDTATIELPKHIAERVKNLTSDWKLQNKTVPCLIYPLTAAETVDRLVTLAHGKGEKAGRDNWNAVAKARHTRQKLKGSESALDLLEKFLKSCRDITPVQAQRWSGNYPLSVLDDAIKKIAPKMGFANARKLADAYPLIEQRSTLDRVMSEIGNERLTHRDTRDKHFGDQFGPDDLPHPKDPKPKPDPVDPKPKPKPDPKKPVSLPVNSIAHIKKLLWSFQPKGKYRGKLVILANEARSLSLETHPHAFCFLLRTMFEISAKAYCKDHEKAGGPKTVQADGRDVKLSDLLVDVAHHLIAKDASLDKPLHGALTELGSKHGLLSVVSLNQLIHNPDHTVSEKEICESFHKIFTLLEAMSI